MEGLSSGEVGEEHVSVFGRAEDRSVPVPGAMMQAEVLANLRDCSIGTSCVSLLEHVDWVWRTGETWLVSGPDGGGRSEFGEAVVRALGMDGGTEAGSCIPGTGDGGAWIRPGKQGLLDIPRQRRVFLVSLEESDRILDREQAIDDSDFVEGGVDPGTTVRSFIASGLAGSGVGGASGFRWHAVGDEVLAPVVDVCGVRNILDRGLRFLSTGELKRAMFARAILADPDVLVVDEPEDGLDAAGKIWIRSLFEGFVRKGRPAVLMVSDRTGDFPRMWNRQGLAEGGRLRVVGAAGLSGTAGDSGGAGTAGGAGAVAAAAALAGHDMRRSFGTFVVPDGKAILFGGMPGLLPEVLIPELVGKAASGASQAAAGSAAEGSEAPLVELRGVSVGWSGQVVLDSLDWIVRKGEHWLVRGPNGAGKSTLLELVTGDHPQAFRNDVRLFGRRRGSGESVWEIKARVGIVSHRLHLEYRRVGDVSLEDALVSGFHDSVGLYAEVPDSERGAAREWLALAGFAGRGRVRFGRLSFGEQRALLVARAAIKEPELLVLDEPCHGLDPEHRERTLALLGAIAGRGRSTLVHVTHDPAEVLDCERRVLELGTGEGRGWRILER